MKINTMKSMIGLMPWLFITSVYAQPHLNNTENSYSTTHLTQQEKDDDKAMEWGLKKEEWQRYLALMKGQLGIYSPNLDPLTALGISARNEAERKHYAELQVIAETKRVERELAYQRAYDEAFKRLYPHLLPIYIYASTTPKPSVLTSLQSVPSKRLALFVKDNCALCQKKVKELQQAGVSFDIYMLNSEGDDERIRRWASETGIEPDKVFSKTITLNHDLGRWQLIGISGDLPALVKEVNGRWQRQ